MTISRRGLYFALVLSLPVASLAIAKPPVLVPPVEPCAPKPGEVTGLLMTDAATMVWDPDACADDYNIYRGAVSTLASGVPPRCHGDEILDPPFETQEAPLPGKAFIYLATGENAAGEGTPGQTSGGTVRALAGFCNVVMTNHTLDRVSYGWSEWSRDRIQALGGLQAYIDEQLDPAFIDESTNTELQTRKASLDPPETIIELVGLDIVNAVYARRQLEQQVAIFWANHFNTEYAKVVVFFNNRYSVAARRRLEGTTLLHRELETFKDLAFNGNFRQIVEASSLSPAMIIYLDTKDNRVGNPNENYARELLELHTFGVDNGYDQQDIVELARVYTGWDVCKKVTADIGDPLAPCIGGDLIDTPAEPDGAWVATFRVNRHDCGEKVLFDHTPAYRTVIPDTCADPAQGVNDVYIALDVIAAHPSTSEYVSGKLLQKFLIDAPTSGMVTAAVNSWNDAGSPQGTGDLREVLRTVLNRPEFLDPDSVGNKIKTPFEHVASGFRAVRGNTNGATTVQGYLRRMVHLPHQNAIPTGYDETSLSWIDTNRMLERQNFGAQMATGTGNNFGADVIGLLEDHGISTTTQGNAAAMVDFFNEVLFSGGLTPVERQKAIDFLNTDDNGIPSLYNAARIRESIGFMLGYPQFQEQ